MCAFTELHFPTPCSRIEFLFSAPIFQRFASLSAPPLLLHERIIGNRASPQSSLNENLYLNPFLFDPALPLSLSLAPVPKQFSQESNWSRVSQRKFKFREYLKKKEKFIYCTKKARNVNEFSIILFILFATDNLQFLIYKELWNSRWNLWNFNSILALSKFPIRKFTFIWRNIEFYLNFEENWKNSRTFKRSSNNSLVRKWTRAKWRGRNN